MKKLILAALVAIVFVSPVYATEFSVSAGPTLVSYDGDFDNGVGASFFISGDIGDGLGAEFEFTRVSADAKAPFGGSAKIGELSTNSIFGNITREIDSPAWFGDKFSVAAKAGLGFVAADLDSGIAGIGFDGGVSPAAQLGVNWEWIIHTPENDVEAQKAGWEQFSLAAVGSAGYVWNDLNIDAETSSGVVGLDNIDGDHGKVFLGLQATKAF